jgi:hypothetical protein
MNAPPITCSAIAGLAYFAVVFVAGFALGVARVMFIVPTLGPTVAVLIELPVILVLSWIACRRIMLRLDISATTTGRLMMVGLAFALLMSAEFAIASFAFGRSLADHLEHYQEIHALLGLAAQQHSRFSPSFKDRPAIGRTFWICLGSRTRRPFSTRL